MAATTALPAWIRVEDLAIHRFENGGNQLEKPFYFLFGSDRGISLDRRLFLLQEDIPIQRNVGIFWQVSALLEQVEVAGHLIV